MHEPPADAATASAAVARRAARGSLWVAAAAWLNRLSVVLVLVVLAHQLDAREFGVLAVASLASNVAFQLNDAGFDDALVWYPGRTREAAETSLIGCIAVGMVLSIAVLLSAPAVAALFGTPEAESLLRLYSLAILADAVASAFTGLLTRELAFGRRFVPEVVPAVLGSLLTVGLALGGAGVWSLVGGDVLRALLMAVLAWAVLPERFPPRWHRDVAAALWRYGRAAITGSFLDFALQNVDYLIVGLALGPVALGFYTLAFRVAILPFLLITYVVAGVAFPLYVRLRDDLGAMRTAFGYTVRITCATTFLLGSGLVALAPSLTVLGARWSPAVPVARWLGVYVCLRSAAYMVTPLLRAIDPVANAALRAAWLVALAVLIATVGRRGIEAVGAVQALVAMAMLVAHAAVGRRRGGIDVARFGLDCARPAVAGAVAAVVVTLLHGNVGALGVDGSWPALLGLGAVFCAVYAGVLLLIMPGLRDDVATLRRVATGPGAAAGPPLAGR